MAIIKTFLTMNVLVFIVAVLAQTYAEGDFHWGYEGDGGPANWAEHYPDCSGQEQSPINIEGAQKDSDLTGLNFRNYPSSSGTYTIKNNGHTIQVDVEGGDREITGGQLPRAYKLAQFHFHWGSQNSQGSEHLLQGKQYPMEVHFVHYSSSYGSLGEAADKQDGLAVVGVFFEVGDQDNPTFANIVSQLAGVSHKDENQSLGTFPLSQLLPESTEQYFRYSGSLTTPGCYQSVIWTVLEDKISISQAQLNAFRSMYQDATGSSHPMVNNFRPVQQLNSRTIRTNSETSGGSKSYVVSAYTVAMAMLRMAFR